MLASSIKQIRMVAAYAAIILGSPDCPNDPTEFVVQRYALTQCPDSAFALASTPADTGLVLKAVSRGALSVASTPVCAGLTQFNVRRDGKVVAYDGWTLDMQIKRSARCELVVGYLYNRQMGDRQRYVQIAEEAAKRVLAGSGAEPVLPAVQSETLHTTAEVRDACKRLSAP